MHCNTSIQNKQNTKCNPFNITKKTHVDQVLQITQSNTRKLTLQIGVQL
jgi:hypothetical protein